MTAERRAWGVRFAVAVAAAVALFCLGPLVPEAGAQLQLRGQVFFGGGGGMLTVQGGMVVQGGMIVQAGDGSAPAATEPQFRVPGESSQASDSIADIQKRIERNEWEKAFHMMEDLAVVTPAPMLRSPDGFVVPCDIQLRAMLLGLPIDGKRAFRVFYDAKAKSMLDAAMRREGDNTTALQLVYDRYFLCAVGETAADRLGDAYFERGQFMRAARCWAEVLEHSAESSIPVLRLRIKRATALSRAGDWAAFDEAARAIRTAPATEKLTIGGREIPVGDYLASLAKERLASATAAETSIAASRRIALPTADRPVWRHEYLNDETMEQISAALRGRGWQGGGVAGGFGAPATVASDGETVYVNWKGTNTALELATGKTTWTQARPGPDTAQRMQRIVPYGMLSDSTLTLDRGNLLTVSMNPNRLPMSQLTCVGAGTGAARWSSGADETMSDYHFAGVPLVAGNVLYAVAMSSQKGEMYLVAMQPLTGKRLWQVSLGVPPARPMGVPGAGLDPRLAYDNGMVYVLTNGGALLAVNAEEQRLSWAYTYAGRPPMPMNDGRIFGAVGGRNADLVIHRGIVYFKEKGDDTLISLSIADMRIVGRKTLDSDDAIVGVDDQGLYVLGESLTARDLTTLEPRWWTSHFGDGGAGPLITPRSVYIFGSKGLFEIDKSSGKVTAMFTALDHDSKGGAVLLAGDRLILVSNTSVTAYRTPPP